MNRKGMSLLLCALLLLAAVPAAAEGGVALTDMKGREITLEAPAARVVALAASDCEILYALGAGDALVGRGEYCDYPEDVLSVPVVNSGAGTNLEQILALDPDVVIMATMNQTVEQVEALEKAGVRVVTSDAQSIQGVYEAIALIGGVTGKTAEAEALIAHMQGAFATLGEAAKDTDKTVYFEISPLQWGLWAAGKGTFMDELATLCGLTNSFADVEGWAAVSEEQVLERNPDYIVTTSMYFGEGPTPVEEINARTGWEEVTAVREGRIFNAENDAITRPGPRLVEAAQALYEFISAPQAEEPAA